MLLLLFSGTKAGAPPVVTPLTVTTCAFQPGAFQYNAFQNCGFKGGWPDTLGRPQLKRKVPRKYLERLLELQKNNTFGRQWFAEFEAAQVEYANAESAAWVAAAAQDAREAAERAEARDTERIYSDVLREVAVSLQMTREVMRTKDIVAAADHAARISRAMKDHMDRLIDQDDDETILLLH